MGQYFKPVNLDKREYVCPWCIGGCAKLWEWAANPWGAIFVMLLRKSSGGGGGDYGAGPTQTISLNANTDPDALSKIVRAGVAREGQFFTVPIDSTVGRWASDRVVLIGDYDESELWDDLPSYRNISEDVVRDWNAFMDIKENQLEYNPGCRCSQRE
jgi:hypothetical protein